MTLKASSVSMALVASLLLYSVVAGSGAVLGDSVAISDDSGLDASLAMPSDLSGHGLLSQNSAAEASELGAGRKLLAEKLYKIVPSKTAPKLSKGELSKLKRATKRRGSALVVPLYVVSTVNNVQTNDAIQTIYVNAKQYGALFGDNSIGDIGSGNIIGNVGNSNGRKLQSTQEDAAAVAESELGVGRMLLEEKLYKIVPSSNAPKLSKRDLRKLKRAARRGRRGGLVVPGSIVNNVNNIQINVAIQVIYVNINQFGDLNSVGDIGTGNTVGNVGNTNGGRKL